MANHQEWQGQNFKKNGPQTLSAGSMHHKLGGVAKFADGGEVDALKSEGLAASNAERETLDKDSSFGQRLMSGLKRFTQGNIDDPKSEAYREYGAGRGETERSVKAASDESAAIAKATSENQAADALKATRSVGPAVKYSQGEFEGVDEAIAKNKASEGVAAVPVKAATTRSVSAKSSTPTPAAAKPASSSQVSAKSDGQSSKSFAADVAERKTKAAAPVKSDTSFDANALNFSSAPAANKNAARTIEKPTPRRGYMSGGTGKSVEDATPRRGYKSN
ncbi:hypothetical protein UFOVP1298_73 [uncultured Caudovirales phage]|uniref:Uncharacterized protein n=1 Tax=uncultured Caudovirales phage TaxID=2100421 RepID=A0A6J5RVE6_9CAUD|nr:hypothetical protein UFOVP1298_73 [uncultured Caudovirales phage]